MEESEPGHEEEDGADEDHSDELNMFIDKYCYLIIHLIINGFVDLFL